MSSSKHAASRTRARVIADYQTTHSDPLTMHAGQVLTLGRTAPRRRGRTAPRRRGRTAPRRRGRTDAEWPGWVWCTDADGKGAWVPQAYVRVQGSQGTALCDYTSRELSVRAGELLTLHLAESGWWWATNGAGDSGWVPATHVETIRTRSLT